MNKKNKKYYHDFEVLKHYGNAVFNVGLWKSEKYLIEKYFSKNQILLDLGCGSGRTTFNLFDLGYKNIIAGDISESMIEQCLNIQLDKKTNINFQVLDATNIELANNSIDNVLFSFNGWTGIPLEKNRIQALKEIYRVLKKDGFFIFTAHEIDWNRYLKNKNKFLLECKDFTIEKEGDFIFKDYSNNCDYLHLYEIETLKKIIEKETKFQIMEIIDRDKNFQESKEVLNFSDNTIFWVLKK